MIICQLIRRRQMFDYERNFFHRSRVKEFLHDSWDFLTSKTGAFLIGVSAILVGSYQFYINKPILQYTAVTNNVISSKNENDFKVIVKSQEYKDLYQTNVTLINNGEQALAGSDVSKIGHDPIRIIIPQGAGVTHYTIDKNETSPAVSAHLEELDNAIIITFDFLNPDNQITATILHQNNVKGFKIVGTAVNVNEITPAWSEHDYLTAITAGLSLLCVLLLANILTKSQKKHNLLNRL